MVVALTDSGAALVNKCSELGKMNRYSVNEYWLSQYPFNFGIPLFWDDLASDMRDANKSLKEILREYARPFMQRNALKKVKAFIFRAKQ